VAANPTKRRTKEHLQQLRDAVGRPEEAEFDAWFDSLPKAEQAKLRALDPPITPYRELPLPRYSFPVYDQDAKFATADPRRADDQPTSDEETWVTKERVQEIISDVLAMLGASPDKAVQHHFDLVRIILQTPDAPTQVDLAQRMGLTKQAVSFRAKKLIHHASTIAPGLLERMKVSENADAPLQADNFIIDAPQQGALRNLFPPTRTARGSSTTAKKQAFPQVSAQESHQLPGKRAAKPKASK
jgi:hypothetical protein